MFSKYPEVDTFISEWTPEMNKRNIELGVLGFLTLFTYFYINSTCINFLYVFLLTKTFSKSSSFESPLQAFFKEITNLFTYWYMEYIKYTDKYAQNNVPGSSKENPIDLTADDDDVNDTEDNNDSSSKDVKNNKKD